MANLVKINDVTLFTGLTEDVADCWACKKILNDAGIKHIVAHYSDELSIHKENFEALSSWSFGADFRQYTFTKYPIVTWKEYYDDYERFVEVAQSSTELAASNLVKNAGLVTK